MFIMFGSWFGIFHFKNHVPEINDVKIIEKGTILLHYSVNNYFRCYKLVNLVGNENYSNILSSNWVGFWYIITVHVETLATCKAILCFLSCTCSFSIWVLGSIGKFPVDLHDVCFLLFSGKSVFLWFSIYMLL